jgi:predicted MFS family arabinose efflux permease
MAAASWWIRSGPGYVWQVVAIAFALGCLQVFDTPARQALVLDTVRAEAAQRALALNALASRLALALGALVAGALIPRGGVPSCYLAIAVVSGLAAVLVLAVRVPQQGRGRLVHPPFLRALREAARLLVDIPAVRTLSIAGIACEIFAFSHSSALPIVAEDVLRAGAEGLGTLNAAVALGGMVAVTLLSLLPGRVRREPLLGAVFVGYGLALLALSAMRALALAAVVLVVIGLCAGAFDVLQQTLIQLAVPDDQRGRAVGIWILGLGSAPFGHLEMGLLAANLGAPEALLINGTITVVAAILLTRVSDYRWTPRPRPNEI